MIDAEARPKKVVWFYTLAGAIVVLDQLSKVAARRWLSPDVAQKVIPGFFDLRLGYNSGGAFGILPNFAPMLIIIGLVAVYAIFRLRGVGSRSFALSVGLGLVLGGAIGNLIDRLASPHGEVTDFLSLYVRISGNTYSWPTFNVADIAIVVGILALFWHVHVIEKLRVEAEGESRR